MLLALLPQHPAFRLLEWNVSDSAWVNQRDATRQLLRETDPDVLVLVQVAPAIDVAGIRAMLAGLRGPADTTWFISSNQSGPGAEHSVIASRDSIRPSAAFAAAQLPDTGDLARRAAVPDSETGRAVAPAAVALRTNGALVRIRGDWFFVAAVHLTCCGTEGSWREYRRQLGATVIRDLVRQETDRLRPAGIVIAGDFNVVTGSAPLDTLLATRPKPPHGDIVRAEAVQGDGQAEWTWDGSGTQFPNGRLDHVLYSSGTLDVVRARVVDHPIINRHRPVLVELQPRMR